MRVLVVTIVLGAFSGAAVAQEAVAVRFQELALGYDADDPEALPRARAALTAEFPDFLEEPLSAGPLRSDLAQSLARDQALALFARAARDPAAQQARWTALAGNLSSRDDLPGLLLEIGALRFVLGDDADALGPVAEAALLRGERDLAAALLADPRSTAETAERLASMASPAALRLLADALTGDVPIPAAALARVVSANPFYDDNPPARPLEPGRIGALLTVAETHEDYAVRLLAARILAASADPAAWTAAYRAYAAADGPGVEADELQRLGRTCWRLPSPDPTARELAFFVFAGFIGNATSYGVTGTAEDEVFAEDVRRWILRQEDPRLAGLALRTLWWADFALCWRDALDRPTLLPAGRALVEDLRDPPREWPADLANLSRRVAEKWTKVSTREDWKSLGNAPSRPASPVLAFLARAEEILDGRGDAAETVREWLREDRDFLADPDCGAAILELSPVARRRLFEAVPEEEIQRLLAKPPARFRVESGDYGDDLSGWTSRDRMLKLLADCPARSGPLRDPRQVLSWPAANRREAGRVLASQAAPPAEIGNLLADDAFAAGYLTRAVSLPLPAAASLAARVVTGAEDRPAVLAALADFATEELEESLSRYDAAPFDPALRPALAEKLRAAADPGLAILAARILASSGTAEDVAALLDAGGGLGVGTSMSRHPLATLVASADSPEKIALLLEFVAKENASPRARGQVFEALADGEWTERLPAESHEDVWARICAFVRDRAPLLGRGLAGHCLEYFLQSAPEYIAEQAVDAFTAGVEKVPAETVRIRLKVGAK